MSGVGWYLSTCGATADQRCRPYFKFSSLYKRYFDCRDLQWVPSEVSWVRALQFVRLLLWQFNSKHFSLKLYHNQSWIGAILLDCISNGIIYGIWSIRLWHIQQNIIQTSHSLFANSILQKPGNNEIIIQFMINGRRWNTCAAIVINRSSKKAILVTISLEAGSGIRNAKKLKINLLRQ